MNNDGERALKLAGKLAIAAQLAVNAGALDLSLKLGELNKALQEYDNHMVDWSRRKAKKAHHQP